MAAPLLAPFLLGAAAGLRAVTPAAAVATARKRPVAGPLLIAAAIGELLADKSAKAPDRTEPAGAAGRLLSGALAGAALGGGLSVAGGLASLAGAAVATRLGHFVRVRLAERAGRDWPVAIAEDAVATALAAYALRRAGYRVGTGSAPE